MLPSRRISLASIRVIILSLAALAPVVRALEFEIDYRYDINDFFNEKGNPRGAGGAAAARATIEAAAARFGAIIDQQLLPAEFGDDADDPRIRFVHPGTGKPIEVSSASSSASDAVNGTANEYRGPWSIAKDTYVLYPGAYLFGDGREGEVESVGNSSTGFGANFISVIDDPNSVINRGFPHPFRNGDRDNLPVWGGAIAFTTHQEIDWHFDHTSTASIGEVDFYSIALHEIAHVLGVNTLEWNNWRGHLSGFEFRGPETKAALAAESNGTAPTPEVADGVDPHWYGETGMSKIFRAGNPIFQGTVGADAQQRSLMYGTLEFAFPDLARFEITNLDAACLRDAGWSTISGDAPVNRPPVVGNTAASVPENTPVGDAVTTVVATDPDAGDTLSYAITDSAFAIDDSGNITVAAPLDFEAAASYTLTVTVTDSGALTATASVIISVTNTNEPPTVAAATASIPEDASVGDAVASVSASDPDIGDSLTYSITGNAFAIDTSGNITVAAPLDFEATPSYALIVTVTDSGSRTDTAAVTISVTNANEHPVAIAVSSIIPEDTPIGDIVATVSASDPDNGDTLSYAITSGNTGGAFAIDGTSGDITVAAQLDDEQNASYTLTVTVTDSGNLTVTATASITISNVPTPVVAEVTGFNISGSSGPGSIPSLSWTAPPGTRFTIMTSTNLRDWLPVTPDIIVEGKSATWTDGQAGFEDPNPPASQTVQKYYRLVLHSQVEPELGGDGGINPARRDLLK